MAAYRSHERRSHFRLRYPEAERPTIRLESGELRISDLSEGGARLVLEKGAAFQAEEAISGVIEFADGEGVPVTGTVLRVEPKFMSVQFTKGPTQKRMVAEQLRLRDRYPLMFDSPESGR